MTLDMLLSGDPADKINVTIAGRTFDCGRRTAAHLLDTFEAFAQEFPDLALVIAQTCYHTGYAPSEGTHDFDGVLDFYVEKRGGGLATDRDYWRVQRWLRKRGWGCWFRHTGSWASRSAWHIHAISLGCPGPVGVYIDGGRSTTGHVYASSQIDDYYRHTYGLKGQHNTDLDQSWFPGDGTGAGPWPVGTPDQWRNAIQKTIFDYPAWKEDHEMNPDQANALKDIQQTVHRIESRDQKQRERDKKRHDAVMAALDELSSEVSDDATKTQVSKAKQKILAALADDEAPTPGL